MAPYGSCVGDGAPPRSPSVVPRYIRGKAIVNTGGGPWALGGRVSPRKSISSCAIFAVLCAGSEAGVHVVGAAEEGRQPTTRVVGFGSVVRPRQWPAKTSRTFWTDAVIAQARENIGRYANARAERDRCVKAANKILKRSDAELVEIIPTAEVPRAFNVSAIGCPVHGKEIYATGGTYPWRLDPNRPFKIQCPVGKEWYPSNDFYAYFRSGMRDRSLLPGTYVDDVWGWVGPNGERYWLVGYACHWAWMKFYLTWLDDLAQAYVLTGDARYAHKAGVILVKIARTYPAMDYCRQSRYSQISGGGYHGKILNLIWETEVFAGLARAYDAIFDAIDGDASLAKLYGYASGEQIRELIESNLLEDGIDAIFTGKIRGNFGMHQRALATAAVVRQTGPVRHWLNSILTKDTSSHAVIGLNYALYNLVYRDGMPYETSPGYCFLWTKTLVGTADALSRAGIDLYRLAKLRSLVDAPLEMICIDKFTPSLGDAGSVWGGLGAQDAGVYQAAYRAYGDSRYAAWLQRMHATGADGFTSFDSLFHPPIEPDAATTASAAERPTSRLMDGYGLALLRNGANTMNVSLYFGMRGGHGHFDRLHFDLFAAGEPMTPDLGYPDFMNGYVPGIYTWSKNTISHNTVTVNKRPQSGNAPGMVQHFVSMDGFRAIDVGASETYPGLAMYRRCLMQVETGPNEGYLVDAFRVRGGDHHAYSLHGPPGTFRVVSGRFTEPAKGTLAGPDVPVGALYDDPVRSKPGYKGTYYGYAGSGYSHFVHAQRQVGEPFVGEWSHAKNTEARLRIHVPVEPEQELLLADAQVSPVKYKELVKYVLVRREGKQLDSTFVSVVEPFRNHAAITGVERLAAPAPVVALRVRRGEQSDIIIQQPDSGRGVTVGQDVQTDAPMTVVRYGSSGRARRAFVAGTGSVRVGGRTIESRALGGTVVRVEPARRCVVVGLGPDRGLKTAADWVGRAVCFVHGERRVWHPVVGAGAVSDGVSLTLGDDLLIGRFRVEKIDGTTISTHTAMMFCPIYAGSYATNGAFKIFAPVREAKEGQITLVGPAKGLAVPGEDIWLCDAGSGDGVLVETALVAQFE